MKKEEKSNILLEYGAKGKGVAPFPTPRCSSYWKGSLLVTLDYGHQQLMESNIESFMLYSIKSLNIYGSVTLNYFNF